MVMHHSADIFKCLALGNIQSLETMITKFMERYISSLGLNVLMEQVPLWCHMASDILVNIGLAVGLVPMWHQSIIKTNADLLYIGPLPTNFRYILIKYNGCHLRNAFEYVVCKMETNLSWHIVAQGCHVVT